MGEGERIIIISNALSMPLSKKRSRWMIITGRRRVYQKYFLSFMHGDVE
jgi:hypothetical protein